MLSQSTRRLDRGPKREVDAEHLVEWLWFVEPLDQLVVVLHLDGPTYRVVQTATGNDSVRLPPLRRHRVTFVGVLAALSPEVWSKG